MNQEIESDLNRREAFMNTIAYIAKQLGFEVVEYGQDGKIIEAKHEEK